MTLTAALAWSRNIIFSKVGLSLGSNAREAAARLYATWLRFGFGGKTGIDVVGESQGLVNDPADRRWREIDVANASFGQGVGTTLIQLAVAYSALVNGGVLVRPRLVESVDGVTIPITVRGTATTPEVSAQMVRMTGQVTSSVPFYAKLTRMDGYAYGGKTGTAQIWLKDADDGKGAWDFEHYNFTFVGWVGKTAPEYVIAISIRRGTPVTQRQGAIVNRIESFELFRRVAQDLIELARGLTHPDHRIDIEGKDRGLGLHRFGKGRAAFEGRGKLGELGLGLKAGNADGNRINRFQQAHARIHHQGHLAQDRHPIREGQGPALAFGSLFGPFFQLDGGQALGGQGLDRGALIFGANTVSNLRARAVDGGELIEALRTVSIAHSTLKGTSDRTGSSSISDSGMAMTR
jgi:hypothetical protein